MRSSFDTKVYAFLCIMYAYTRNINKCLSFSLPMHDHKSKQFVRWSGRLCKNFYCCVILIWLNQIIIHYIMATIIVLSKNTYPFVEHPALQIIIYYFYRKTFACLHFPSQGLLTNCIIHITQIVKEYHFIISSTGDILCFILTFLTKRMVNVFN